MVQCSYVGSKCSFWLKRKGILYFIKLPDDDPTTRSSEPLDHELDSEQLKADATCRVVCLGFRTTAHGDKAEPDIKITRWNNIPKDENKVNANYCENKGNDNDSLIFNSNRL